MPSSPACRTDPGLINDADGIEWQAPSVNQSNGFWLMSRIKSGSSTLVFDHCKEIALLPGSLFEFTSRFIPEALKNQLLALYALINLIESVARSPVDDSVKWAKLTWWSDELAADPKSSSRHPVLRALQESGARTRLDKRLLLRLVNNAALQIDVAADADEKAMFERLAAESETAILLELALTGSESDLAEQYRSCLAAASGVYSMISAYFEGRQIHNLRPPLNLMAKYQLTTSQLQQKSGGQEFEAVMSQLAVYGVEWFAQGRVGLDGSESDLKCDHLQLRWAVESRLLERCSRNTAAFLSKRRRFGPADAWYAWHFCRKLK